MLFEQCIMCYVWCITSYYIIALITRWGRYNHTIHQSAYKDTKKIPHMQAYAGKFWFFSNFYTISWTFSFPSPAIGIIICSDLCIYFFCIISVWKIVLSYWQSNYYVSISHLSASQIHRLIILLSFFFLVTHAHIYICAQQIGSKVTKKKIDIYKCICQIFNFCCNFCQLRALNRTICTHNLRIYQIIPSIPSATTTRTPSLQIRLWTTPSGRYLSLAM